MRVYLFLLILKFVLCSSTETKSKLTLDEFFNYTNFQLLSLSPNGQYLLINIRRPEWNSNSFENSLWLYETHTSRKKLITKQLSQALKPQWSPTGNWFIFLLKENSSKSSLQNEQHFYLYSIVSDELLTIPIETNIPLAITWSNNDSSLYFAAFASKSINEDEWKDVIQYRKKRDGSTIYRIDIDKNNRILSVKLNLIKNLSFLIGELLFIPSKEKLIFSSISNLYETLEDFEIYSIDLQNLSSLSRLTNNEALEHNLQLSTDKQCVIFQVLPLSIGNGKFNDTQDRLYCVNLTNGNIERLGKDFNGNIASYATKSDGGIYILGQLGTNVQIYTQQSSTTNSILHDGWIGTYESISSSKHNNSIAFVYSAFGRPKEVYFIDNIHQLQSPKSLTNENQLLTKRNLPQGKVYRWINDEDNRIIEGILHYPPGKFEDKNLPLFVHIHGGPYAAWINHFDANAYFWASYAASEEWLVFEPNYRGSTGYGDQFLAEIRHQPLSRIGRDILAGVDQLIKDGIANPNQLAVGGYSYGGFLTNWLITQTTRFNAALSGAGAVEYVSAWGTMDMPTLINDLFGGFPWEIPHIYQNESPIYQFNKVRTPTHIVTGTDDIRVPTSQSYILERALHYLKVPTQLLLFPTEGHTLNNNPWHSKIKIREQLKWLQKYGHNSSITIKNET